MKHSYKCLDCKSFYSIPAGVPIRCPKCLSKERDCLGDYSMEELEEAITEAWQVINVLQMNAMDSEGESRKRALDWLHEWEHLRPNASSS